ncbi:MAG: hypothetical protein DRH90_21430 [Deltaproteobacteria bacterium]|nr:MAG: hypothetical protein DRH90_21430 [Deltaproteobacteria bacterium]RLC08611.1 MAG: hypothetical protein DRI24_23095 [Deltaproteobacteria bacterium]
MQVEQPPENTDIGLSGYLVRMFKLIDREITFGGKLPVRTLLAPKPIVGKLYYYDRAIDTDITQEGLYIYKTTGYEFIK